MSSLIVDLIREYHRHPLFTVVLAVGLCGSVWFSWITYAQADDVEKINRKISNLEVDVYNISVQLKRDRAESRIEDLESRIFDLRLLQNNGTIQEEQQTRLRDLEIELRRKQRELALVPNTKEKASNE